MHQCVLAWQHPHSTRWRIPFGIEGKLVSKPKWGSFAPWFLLHYSMVRQPTSNQCDHPKAKTRLVWSCHKDGSSTSALPIALAFSTRGLESGSFRAQKAMVEPDWKGPSTSRQIATSGQKDRFGQDEIQDADWGNHTQHPWPFRWLTGLFIIIIIMVCSLFNLFNVEIDSR